MQTTTVIPTDIFVMSSPPRRNLYGRQGRHESDESFLRRCITYVNAPYAVTLTDDVQPSDMINELFNSTPSSQHPLILWVAVYYRVLALEPEYSVEIANMLLDRFSRGVLLFL